MLRDRVTRLLKIHPGDLAHLVDLSVLNLLLVSLHSFGTSIVTSLFLKRYGVDFLPRMYLISPLAVVACTLLVLRLSAVRRSVLLSASCAVFGAVVVAARVLLLFDLTIACPLLYILNDLLGLFFYTQFWALAIEACDVREGKRIFTYVVCAGLAGGGLAGAGVNLLAGRFGNGDLLVLWAALFFAVALYVRKFISRQAPSPAGAGTGADSAFTGRLKDTAVYFARSGHVRILMACVVLAAVSGNFVDFVFNKIMDGSFPDENRLTAFYGTYSLFFYSGTLIVQLFITNRVVAFLGTGSSLLLLPASITLGFGSLAAAFGYYTGVVTKFFKDLITASFSDSNYPLMFSPLEDRFRNSIMAICEGLLTPLGTACAGGILMLVADRPGLTVVSGIAFASLWVYFGFLLKNSYQSAFIGNLAAKSLPDISTIKDSGNMSEGQAVLLLSRALRSKDDTVSRFAMRTLAGSRDTAAADLLVRYLGETPSSGRKADLLHFLGRREDGGRYLPAAERFLADPDPLVRAKAVGAFLSAGDARARDRILPFLGDADPRVRVNAVMVLWRSCPKKEYLDILSSAARDRSETVRCWAGFALRELNSEESVPLLLELSRDGRPKVRLEAVKGLGPRDGEEAGARLVEMLRDGSRKVRQAAYRSLVGKEGVSNLLIKKYETGRRETRERFIRILAARREGKDIVFRYLEEELSSLYKRTAWITTLKREQQTPALELFIATLANRNRAALDKILKISSSIEGSTAFGLIVKRLKDKDTRSFAEVLELLDTMTLHKRSFLRSVVSLLEGMPDDELAAYARRELGIREYSAEEIYTECLQDPAEEWFKGCVLHILGTAGAGRHEAVFREHLRSASAFIRELCRANLAQGSH